MPIVTEQTVPSTYLTMSPELMTLQRLAIRNIAEILRPVPHKARDLPDNLWSLVVGATVYDHDISDIRGEVAKVLDRCPDTDPSLCLIADWIAGYKAAIS